MVRNNEAAVWEGAEALSLEFLKDRLDVSQEQTPGQKSPP